MEGSKTEETAQQQHAGNENDNGKGEGKWTRSPIERKEEMSERGKKGGVVGRKEKGSAKKKEGSAAVGHWPMRREMVGDAPTVNYSTLGKKGVRGEKIAAW